MTDWNQRILDAKRQTENLKTLVTNSRSKTNDASMVSVVADKTIRVLNGLPKCRRILKGHFGKVYSLHWASDSTHLISASQDGKLIVWNAQTTNKTHAIPLRSSWIMTCAFEQRVGDLVVCGGLDNLCSIFRLGGSHSSASDGESKTNGSPSQSSSVSPNGNTSACIRATKELSGHDGYISCCRFIDESSLVSASGDSNCRIWDTETGECKQLLTNEHTADVMSIAMPSSSSIIASGSCDATVRVWDVRSGLCEKVLAGHESDVNSVCFFPDQDYCIGTGSDDSSCRLFDLRYNGQVNEFASNKIICGVTSVSFSSSGRIMFAGYDDFNIMGWDTVSSGKSPSFSITAHENRVSSVGVCNSGQALCTGSWDTLLKV